MAAKSNVGTSGGTIKTITTELLDQSHKTRCPLTGPGIIKETSVFVPKNRLQVRIAYYAEKGQTLIVSESALSAEIKRIGTYNPATYGYEKRP